MVSRARAGVVSLMEPVTTITTDRRRGGRPTRAEAPAQCVVRIRLTPDERGRLEKVAKENGTTLVAVLRDAMDDYVADYGAPPIFYRST